MTPWFAVALGLVVAASMSMSAPRATLTFPPSQKSVCGTPLCAGPQLDYSGANPAIRGEIKLPMPAITPASRSRQQIPGKRRRPLVVRVWYGLLPSVSDGRRAGRHRFLAAIEVDGNQRIGWWRLRFRLPGGRISQILTLRAGWYVAASRYVEVSGGPPPWARSGSHEVKLLIYGTGHPRWPNDCTFDTVPCTFRPLSQRPGGPGGAGIYPGTGGAYPAAGGSYLRAAG